MSTPDRVAVVVVHGIADQRAGQTVRELARLLCHGGAGEPRYVQGEMHEVLVPKVSNVLFPNGISVNVTGELADVTEKLAETSIP